MQLIDNPEYVIQYFSVKEKKFVDPTSKISRKLFTDKSLSAHTANSVTLIADLNEYHCVLEDIYPIPPRTRWIFEDGKFIKLKKIINLIQHASYETCIRTSRRLLQKLNGRIAVELSGGLDSSIVIGMLNKLGCEPVLIGTKSQLYKFRTERHIQEIIAKKFKTVIFNDTYKKQFSNILDTPAHFLPCAASLNQPMIADLIPTLKEHNIRYIFNGIAFDAMLVEPINNNPDAIKWPTLDDNWANDYAFNSHGLSYIDVAALSPLKTLLLSLRNGSEQDSSKWWARKFFADLIPNELSQYAYKANYGEQWWDGIEANAEQIETLVNNAWEITSLSAFENFSIESLHDRMNEADQLREQFALLSYANWVYALHRTNRLTE